jgi:hypothetical protein
MASQIPFKTLDRRMPHQSDVSRPSEPIGSWPAAATFEMVGCLAIDLQRGPNQMQKRRGRLPRQEKKL